jgi:hypothetical protein
MSSTYRNHIHTYLIAVPGIDSTQVAWKKDKCKHSYICTKIRVFITSILHLDLKWKEKWLVMQSSSTLYFEHMINYSFGKCKHYHQVYFKYCYLDYVVIVNKSTNVSKNAGFNKFHVGHNNPNSITIPKLYAL